MIKVWTALPEMMVARSNHSLAVVVRGWKLAATVSKVSISMGRIIIVIVVKTKKAARTDESL